jgi:predicted phosphodiesterase
MKVLTVTDLHVGSRFAISPPEFETEDRVVNVKRNAVSRAIYKNWVEMCDDINPVDVLVLKGDLTDGVNYKSKGLGQWTTELTQQLDAALELINMIKVKKKKIVVQGSWYHVYDNLSTDEAIARDIGATYDDDIALKVDKIRFYFRHFIPISRSVWMYRATPIAREMLLAELHKQEFGKFDIMGFGHTHYFCAVEFGNSYGYTCPCWKGRDGYAKRGTIAWMPTLGYIMFNIKGSNWERSKHTFHLKGKNLIREVKV